MSEVRQFPFTPEGANKIKEAKFGMNWPVVYLINNDAEIYVGESSNVFYRTKSHLANPERKNLSEINIIYDQKFNKSAILDIESMLIQYMSADQKYILQNKNGGQSQAHDYYQRQMYISAFEELWKKLKKLDLVDKDLTTIKNSDLFKFSPYKSLTTDQYQTAMDLLCDILANIGKKDIAYIVNGSAGTGKTVLAVYLMKLISDCVNQSYNMDDLEDEDEIYSIMSILRNSSNFEIGLVVPMTSLRKTLKSVFRRTKGLKASMVIGPNDVTKKKYDLLIVDEAHRLKRRVNLSNYESFDKTNELLGLGKEGTELDWILKSSKFQILFYDESQSIKPTDIRPGVFAELKCKDDTKQFFLSSQLRVLGGNEYMEYIQALLSDNPPVSKPEFADYEFKLFDNLDEMIQEIKSKDAIYGLCRTVAGYSWGWKNKGKSYEKIIKDGNYDIEIEGKNYIWNTEGCNWVNSEHALDEIGCIHTTQGYDLNYTGVIFGNEITYNEQLHRIEINAANYHDMNGKRGINDENELRNYILQIYRVLMTRGIRGTYVYACDAKLREYLKNQIEIQ